MGAELGAEPISIVRPESPLRSRQVRPVGIMSHLGQRAKITAQKTSVEQTSRLGRTPSVIHRMGLQDFYEYCFSHWWRCSPALPGLWWAQPGGGFLAFGWLSLPHSPRPHAHPHTQPPVYRDQGRQKGPISLFSLFASEMSSFYTKVSFDYWL